MESNEYYCDLCNFQGKSNKSFLQHKKTLKHMRNLNNKIKEESIDKCQFIDNQNSLSNDALNNINSNISTAINQLDKLDKIEENKIIHDNDKIVSNQNNKNFYRDIDTLTVNNINNLNIRFRNMSREEIIKLFNTYQNMEFNNKTGSFSNTKFS